MKNWYMLTFSMSNFSKFIELEGKSDFQIAEDEEGKHYAVNPSPRLFEFQIYDDYPDTSILTDICSINPPGTIVLTFNSLLINWDKPFIELETLIKDKLNGTKYLICKIGNPTSGNIVSSEYVSSQLD